MKYASKNVLITGGAGFLGSNLAIALVEQGARVTIVDNFLPGHGSNRYNLDPVKERVHLNIADIRYGVDESRAVAQDYIFIH